MTPGPPSQAPAPADVSPSELAFLEAAALFGASAGAARFFHPHVREELAPLVEAVGSGAPLPANLSCFDRLRELSSVELASALTGFGLYQVAALWKDQSRRQLARLQHRLQPSDLERLAGYLETRPRVDLEEHHQIEEIYVALTRRFPNFETAILQIGLFFVAAAARDRFEADLETIALTLAPEHAAGLVTYTTLLSRSARPGIVENSYRALRDYLVETSSPASAPGPAPPAGPTPEVPDV